MRKIATIFGGVVVVLVAAVFIVPRVIDWNMFKPRIASAVQAATGRDFHIDGNLVVRLFPDAEFSASGIGLANVAGAKAPEMVKVGSIDGKIKLWPLLSGTLVVERMIISDPEVNLQVDQAGRPNWEMNSGNAQSNVQSGGGSGFKSIRLGDVRIERGKFNYSDAASGQDLAARDLNVTVTMPDLSQPLAAKISLVLNDEPTTFNALVDTPSAVMAGEPATLTAALENKRITFRLDGRAAEGGASGLAGVLDLNVPSVGQLAAWLDRPLDSSQPDPGQLNVHADFDASQTGVVLKTATIQGSGLNASASGSVEGANGGLRKLVFKLDGGLLDIDRYLPKPASRPAGLQRASSTNSPAGDGDPLAMLPDTTFDLQPLRTKEIDVQVKLEGIKAHGFQIGTIDLGAQMTGGKLDATIREVQLYGGKITGETKLDASGAALAVDTRLAIDKVNVGTLAKAAMAGGDSPIAGIASGTVTASGNGTSPRAFAQSLVGNLDFDISGADRRDTAMKLTALKLAVALPGIDKQPTIKASATYNGQPITIDVTGDTTRKLLGDNRFQLTASLDSPVAKASYDGAVVRQPTPALDGKFELSVASVGRLLSWAGTPLPQGQPDPGLLNVSATMSGEGGKATLKDARIEGKAIKATASGSFDATKTVPEFNALINVEQANLNAYLPAQARTPAKAPPQKSAGWSDAPIDVSALSKLNGKIDTRFKSVRYLDLVVESGQVQATIANSALKAVVQDVKLAKGSINASADLAAANNGLTLAYQASVVGFDAQPLLVTFAGTDWLSGTAEFATKGHASGRSQKDLISTLNGDGSFKFLNGAIHGINLAALLRQAKTLGFDQSARETQQTDFAELSGTFTIRDGVFENKDLKMLAPAVRLAGNGQVPMPPRTVDYSLTATLVATLEGQGGKEGINGLPIPIRVTGGWDAPSYNVDWKGVFAEAAKDPARLQSLPADLQAAAKGFGVNIPGLPAGGGLGGILGAITGAKGGSQQPSSENPPEDKTSPAPDVGNALRSLFGK